jgi:hypothetical protein
MKVFRWFLMMAVVAGLAMADVDVTGRWAGSFNVTDPNGETKESTALLLLKQNGSEITGTLGPNDGEQRVITKGKISGDRISLESTDGGLTIKFELVVAGDRITGGATAVDDTRKRTAKLDVTRAK